MWRRRVAQLREALSWRRRLGVRIVAVLVVVAALFAGAASAHDYRVEREALRERLIAHGRTVIRQAALACPDLVLADIPALEAYIEEVVRLDPILSFAIVQRADGTTLCAKPAGAVPRQSPTMLLLVEPVFAVRGSPEIATLYLGISQEPMLLELRERASMLALRSGLTFLLVGAVLWLLLRFVVVRPIHRLDQEALRLGSGALAAPLPDFGGTEIGRLARTLDRMRANLQQSHRELAEQNRQLLALDRLKSQFLANISHELRTPLTSILGGAQLLGDATLPPAERSEFVAAVQRNGEQMLDLVDRLLDLTKLESGALLITKAPCRPATVIQEACDPFRRAAGSKGLELSVDVAGLGDLVVDTDPARLRQVVRAVVDNAVKFTDRGSVAVRATVQEQPLRRLLVVVEDTGPGMPGDCLADLFVPFRQGDGSSTRRHGGTGIGLCLVQRIARCLGGDVVIASTPGVGTRVEITIDAGSPVQPSVPAALSEPTPAAKGRVLVVDDAADNRRLLKALLTKLGLAVDLAENGRIAVERVEAASATASYDLVVMDLQMPELDGVAAIRELRAKGFAVPIVALTAHALAEDRERCLAAGADAYESKPISARRLGEIVAAHVRRAPS